MSGWTRKDLLGLDELSAEEIRLILDTAKAFKGVGERSMKKVPALRGQDDGQFFRRAQHARRARRSSWPPCGCSADVINIAG